MRCTFVAPSACPKEAVQFILWLTPEGERLLVAYCKEHEAASLMPSEEELSEDEALAFTVIKS